MLQRDVLQFYERGWADAETQVSIAPGAAPGTMPAVRPRDDDEAPWVVGRLDLWGAAVRLIATHPLLGVGPDNFRHYYGAELGLAAGTSGSRPTTCTWSSSRTWACSGWWRLHGSSAGHWSRRREADARSYVAARRGLGSWRFLVHGLLDSFLAFNPTAWLLWLLLGVVASATVRQKPHVSGR